MKEEVWQYCLTLVLNSKIEDWNSDKEFIINNLIIDYGYEYFRVKIYKDNTHKEAKDEITFHIYTPFLSIFIWSRKRRKENNLIKKKYKEVKSYFENKSEYEAAFETYNLLPIKELRKKKLEKINENESQLDS